MDSINKNIELLFIYYKNDIVHFKIISFHTNIDKAKNKIK
jgi:hypothetical protein